MPSSVTQTLVPLFRRGGKKNKDDTMGRVQDHRALVIIEHHRPKQKLLNKTAVIE